MGDILLQYLLEGSNNVSPNAKELLLSQATNEFDNGNILNSVFYQVRALHQSFQDHYQAEAYWTTSNTNEQNVLQEMNDWEKVDFKSNTLMQYAVKTLGQKCRKPSESNSAAQYNFLKNITNPIEGIEKIQNICSQLPKEWTILQLCKGPRNETTYSIYPQIHESDACIYLTILRHARSAEYPNPICIRFSGSNQQSLYMNIGKIAKQFKERINVTSKSMDKEAKKQYWDMLGDCNNRIMSIIKDMKDFLFPWCFLFKGRPFPYSVGATYEKRLYSVVDEFCNANKWEANERVILSLAAVHVHSLSQLEVYAICKLLTDEPTVQSTAAKLLFKFQCESIKVNKNNEPDWDLVNNYPCILVVDERLDHFFWEEVNVEQEICRVNTLQMLWTLFEFHKNDIKNGYLNVNITDGGCIINPDCNLPKTELRMKKFFEYWLPDWYMKIAEKPTQDELLNNFFKRNCYVYAGHGSGLQYIHGKYIAKHQMNCVVFLFGCDSSRLHSNGLFSEMVGPHLYYHAAMCPTLVGTLMPALDANMDTVATCILSRWIAPKNAKTVIPWNCIDFSKWTKEGIIKPNQFYCEQKNISATYSYGSLCKIVAQVHERSTEKKYYNTVPYVCRGLPAWNCSVQSLSK